MPTKPYQEILYRELSSVRAKEIGVNIFPLLEELVNNATNVLIRCTTSPTTQEDDIDLAAVHLYRHQLELTDAFAVLIESGISTPTIPIVRTIFETWLSLEFILEDDELYRRRSLQWLANHIRNKLVIYETFLSDSDRGRKFATTIEKDKTINIFPEFPQEEIAEGISRLTSLLAKDKFIEIQLEYDRIRKETSRNPNWYSLFGGPRNLEILAGHLNRNAQYEFLYRYWSRFSHAQDFSLFFTSTQDGSTQIKRMRDPSRIKEFSSFVLTFMVESSRSLLLKFRPGEDFSAYYTKEVRDRFLKSIRNE